MKSGSSRARDWGTSSTQAPSGVHVLHGTVSYRLAAGPGSGPHIED